MTTSPHLPAPTAPAAPTAERFVVAVAGNPNSGKSTLFHALTGRRVKIGNYPGVTVEERRGAMRAAPHVELVDIPGTYSLVARTGEEQLAIGRILGLGAERARPDLVVLCVDATQILRGLYLALQLGELGVPMVIALTLSDEATHVPDVARLGSVLQCPVVATAAKFRRGLGEIERAIIEHPALRPSRTPQPAVWRWQPSAELATALDEVTAALPASWLQPSRAGEQEAALAGQVPQTTAQPAQATDQIAPGPKPAAASRRPEPTAHYVHPPARALALWALQSIDVDDELHDISPELRTAVLAHQARAEAFDLEVATQRYAWLSAAVEPLLKQKPSRAKERSDRLDAVLIHRFSGMAIFLAIMFVVFMSLFSWSGPAIDAVDGAMNGVKELARSVLPAGLFADFVTDGVLGGVGSVLVFLPQILLLFFFLGALEDSGYLARVAYLMDRIMRAMNLHGKAFVPMLSGFACAVPAILATRTMERQRDRILTMMVIPLMTCSARLPVYTLIIGALYAGQRGVQSLLMVAIYLFSMVMALVAAWAMSKTMPPLKAKRLPFIIELPPYRLPLLRDVVRQMWERTRLFLTEAGTVILACTVVLWALSTFPRAPGIPPECAKPTPEAVAAAAGPAARDGDQAAGPAAHTTTPTATNVPAPEPAPATAGAPSLPAPTAICATHSPIHHSYAAKLGRAMEPVIEPLGFDWQIGIGILGAFAAREVFVATMGVVYNIEGEVDEESPKLREAIRAQRRADGSPLFTPLVGLSLMVFFALACQCISTLAVVKRETHGYRWPLFLFAYMTAAAWVASFAVYQGGKLLGFE